MLLDSLDLLVCFQVLWAIEIGVLFRRTSRYVLVVFFVLKGVVAFVLHIRFFCYKKAVVLHRKSSKIKL